MKTVRIESDRYFDSVFLMQISRKLQAVSGVSQAVVSMGTTTNIDNLTRIGFDDPALTHASPNDLVIAVDAETSEAAKAVAERLDELLAVQPDPRDDAASRATSAPPTTIPHAARPDFGSRRVCGSRSENRPPAGAARDAFFRQCFDRR